MTTYRAFVERDGKWWMVRVPKINGVSQARSLAEAGKMAHNLVAGTLGADPASFDIDLVIDQVGDVAGVSAEVATIKALREQAARKEREATTRAGALAKRLADEGVTMRDIGSMLGVTFQRAHQLVIA